ncbi:MAG: Ldh family oxidoreductase, partial [Rhodospirillales bacterium]
MKTVPVPQLQTFVADIFAKAGCSAAEGKRIAHYLTQANLVGHDSHGVIRVPRYVEALKGGTVLADQTIDRVIDTPVLAVVDGKFGFGQTVTPQAVQLGIDKAKASGVAVIALRNSGHLGRAGDWAEMAAAAGIISIHFVNVAGSLLVAPFGSVERRISTAPFCVGVPMPPKDGKPGNPLILDFATALVAEGKVLVASNGGKKVPDNAMIERDGSMSGNPATLYGPIEGTSGRDAKQGKGAIRTFGEHKGSGLAFMCEILGGALTGGGTCGPGPRQLANGMLS